MTIEPLIMNPPPEASLSAPLLRERISTRFGFSLMATFLGMVFSFFSSILIARNLGATGYGDLNFLLASFASLTPLLDMGSSVAFYTFLSQKRQTQTFLVFYLSWLIIQFVAVLAVVALILPGPAFRQLWLGQEKGLVLLAFIANFLTTRVWSTILQLGEARRKTLLVQGGALLQAFAHWMLILAAISWGHLTVARVIGLLVLEYGFLSLVLGPSLFKHNLLSAAADPTPLSETTRKFINYCKPLALYTLFGVLYGFADRWLLQRFGGATQQGFFSISQLFASVGTLATSSMLQIYWKEIAEAKARHDQLLMHRLYHTVSRSLYFMGAFIGCFFIPYSRDILFMTVGSAYGAAVWAFALMLLYPIHQSLGQIQGSFLQAVDETRAFARIGLWMMPISIPIAYFLMAPSSARVPGFGLGATGLALKMVSIQAIWIIWEARVIARLYGWSSSLLYQVWVVGWLVGLSVLCKFISWHTFDWFASSGNPLGILIFGGILYAGINLVIVTLKPRLTGLTDEGIALIKSTSGRWLAYLS